LQGFSKREDAMPSHHDDPRDTNSTHHDGVHPFAQYVNPPLADLLRKLNLDKRFVRGRGNQVYDENGRPYLDCVASFGALPFGHNPRGVWEALSGVRRKGEPNFVQPSILDAAGELAERLVRLAPGGGTLCHVTFVNSGTEATEAALKMARAATGRRVVVSTRNSFHGKTLGALAVTGNEDYQQGFGVPLQDVAHVPYGDAEALRTLLEERQDAIAAFIVEPIQGEGGVVEPPPDYLSRVRQICDYYGVLLIVDEVQTGLGRTGSLFACDEVVPDIITLAKALGGGLIPIGAVLANDRAYSEHFARKHSSTFAGNALGCRAALETLRLLTEHDGALVGRVRVLGARLKRELLRLQRRFPSLIADVRGHGLLLGIELSPDRRSWPSRVLGVASEQGFLAPLVASYLLNVEGVRVAPTLNGRSVLRVEPPLTFRWGECRRLVAALHHTLEAAAAGRLLAGVFGGETDAVPGRVAPPLTTKADDDAEPQPLPEERRFAFLLHPMDAASFADFDPALASLPADVLGDIAGRLSGVVRPFLLSRARVTSPTGESVFGEFIVIPRTAQELFQMPKPQAVATVQDALELARAGGAQLAGLGAFTSVVTRGGLLVAGRGLPLTTGNCCTVVACTEAIDLALVRLGRRSVTARVAVLGATGSIGRGMAVLLAERAEQLILIGNPAGNAALVRQRLREVAVAACEHLAELHRGGQCFPVRSIGARLARAMESLPIADRAARLDEVVESLEREGLLLLTQDAPSALSRADVVVTASSATSSVVSPADLAPSAVVCDLARPANVGQDIAAVRPDVLVIDGGIIAIPGNPYLGEFGLGRGKAFACMAETMLLTFASHFEDTGLGADLALDTVRLLRSLAGLHGFRVASLRSFGRELGEADWRRLQAAQPRRAS
jgi:acetylornithine/succinyldiaminopimelate/putrescine aminotransferase/predicted amino acid dehydrogenase